MQILGIDIGGTGIKGAVVDVSNGKLVTERFRLLTPHPAKPSKVVTTVGAIAEHFEWKGLIGCTFPGIVRQGVVETAPHIDPSWVGKNGQALLQKKTGQRVVLLNDADAAGIAEMEFGAGRGEKGLVLMLTFGTGIGCGLFFNGELVPNAELGHLEIHGMDAEEWVSDRIRQEQDMSWKKWAKHLSEYLSRLAFLLSPELFIIGGGVSKHHDKFMQHLKVRTRVVPAQFLNEAGIVGAALAAAKGKRSRTRARGLQPD